jgi:hypothetical protein
MQLDFAAHASIVRHILDLIRGGSLLPSQLTPGKSAVHRGYMKATKAVSVFEKLYVLEQVGLFGGRCENYVAKVDDTAPITALSGVTYCDDPSEAMIGCENTMAPTADRLRDKGHPVILTPLSEAAA